jgi:hypothetical protein
LGIIGEELLIIIIERSRGCLRSNRGKSVTGIDIIVGGRWVILLDISESQFIVSISGGTGLGNRRGLEGGYSGEDGE